MKDELLTLCETLVRKDGGLTTSFDFLLHFKNMLIGTYQTPPNELLKRDFLRNQLLRNGFAILCAKSARSVSRLTRC